MILIPGGKYFVSYIENWKEWNILWNRKRDLIFGKYPRTLYSTEVKHVGVRKLPSEYVNVQEVYFKFYMVCTIAKILKKIWQYPDLYFFSRHKNKNGTKKILLNKKSHFLRIIIAVYKSVHEIFPETMIINAENSVFSYHIPIAMLTSIFILYILCMFTVVS